MHIQAEVASFAILNHLVHKNEPSGSLILPGLRSNLQANYPLTIAGTQLRVPNIRVASVMVG